jgi:predicted HTH transcriptional regulator
MPDCAGQFVIDFSTATRKSHPDTSRIAEHNITKSGKRAAHCKIILKTLRQHNGSTSGELSLYCELTKEQIHHRMNDIVENGDIKRGDPRKCQVKKTKCSTWWIL